MEALDVVFVLMLLQGSFGLVAGIGFGIFSAAARALAVTSGLVLATLATSLLVIVFGMGIVRRKAWARRGALVFEMLALVTGILRSLPIPGFDASLVALLTLVVLPLAVVLLLRSRGVREACAKRSSTSA
jgi:hypothetical protein